MSRYLCSVIENYRVDNESEVDELISEARDSHLYDLKKSSVQKKEVKEKKEIVDEFVLVSLTKFIQDPKNPEMNIELKYEV
jgi:hypothetical protein